MLKYSINKTAKEINFKKWVEEKKELLAKNEQKQKDDMQDIMEVGV